MDDSVIEMFLEFLNSSKAKKFLINKFIPIMLYFIFQHEKILPPLVLKAGSKF